MKFHSVLLAAMLASLLTFSACQPPISGEDGVIGDTDIALLEAGISPRELIYVLGISGMD